MGCIWRKLFGPEHGWEALEGEIHVYHQIKSSKCLRLNDIVDFRFLKQVIKTKLSTLN